MLNSVCVRIYICVLFSYLTMPYLTCHKLPNKMSNKMCKISLQQQEPKITIL